ncbi:MAG TPA: MarR family transcriptional regulator [Burkholderiaceae bacterium]|nr:MarR family transcriptional regulator [Burkholderiaceae bacterium]
MTAAYPGHARFLPYLLNRVTSRLNVDFQLELHRRGLTLTHWRVLAFLSERDGLPVTELAGMIAADQSTVSRALLRLEREGRIERRPAASDNRVVEVFITDAGRALFHDILPTALRLHQAAVRGIDARELAALSRTLTRILANLG